MGSCHSNLKASEYTKAVPMEDLQKESYARENHEGAVSLYQEPKLLRATKSLGNSIGGELISDALKEKSRRVKLKKNKGSEIPTKESIKGSQQYYEVVDSNTRDLLGYWINDEGVDKLVPQLNSVEMSSLLSRRKPDPMDIFAGTVANV